MIRILSIPTCLVLSFGLAHAAGFPQAEITNGLIKAKLYLPDAAKGYYLGTRFDWSGVIYSLEYQRHNYYGPWFDGRDPKIRDFSYVGAQIIAGPCSAITGPVDEFQAMGFDDAKPGGTFLKIGVGALRKDDRPYTQYSLYEIANQGKWTVRKRRDSVEFTHVLSDAPSGYGYVYRKTVRLIAGKPEMALEHSLKNTGKRTIRGTVYNHNFLTLDKQPPGPDFTISVPYQIQTSRPPNKDLAEIRGARIVYLKTLQDRDVVSTPVQGFGASAGDHEIRIENSKVGAGMRIVGDRPLSNNSLWSIRTVLAIEPFVALDSPPGGEFSWKTTYEYYTLPATGR